jgi:gliding motility-associated-like protein
MASLDTLSGEQVQYTFPDEGGTYEITYRVAAYTGEQVCRDTTTAGEVEILDIEVIRVPNVFTPNGDGINDQLRVRTQGIESMTVIIYDRWGNQVASGDYQPSGQQRVAVWDGNLANGGEAAAGAYFYVIDAETAKGLQVDRSGNVSLMR